MGVGARQLKVMVDEAARGERVVRGLPAVLAACVTTTVAWLIPSLARRGVPQWDDLGIGTSQHGAHHPALWSEEWAWHPAAAAAGCSFDCFQPQDAQYGGMASSVPRPGAATPCIPKAWQMGIPLVHRLQAATRKALLLSRPAE